MHKCNCLETHIPRNGHTFWPSECNDYAPVCNETLPCTVAEEEEDYAFCKVCDDSFSVAHSIAEGMLSVTPHGPHQSRTQTHRGIEQTVTTNSSVRQFSRLRRRLPIQKQ